MEVTRTSRLTGVTRTIDLPITEEQLIDFGRGARVQDALWNLSAEQREFFMTGITEDEWQKFIVVHDEDDEEEADEPDHGNSFTKNEDNYYDEN